MRRQIDETKPSAGPGSANTISARELFNNSTQLRIHHAGKQYLLTITRNNKLILTK